VETVEVKVTATPGPTGTQKAASGDCCDVYRIALFEDPTTTNYWNLLGPGSIAWNFYILEDQAASLYTLSDVTYQFVPHLAKEIVAPVDHGDGTWTITVPMVEDATWSDGQPIMAHDFVFTFNTCKDLVLTQSWPCAARMNLRPK
jgi:ABC-type transport system substrate-binding protein